MVNEVIFLVEEADEGGYQARALEHSIFTDADTMESLKDNIREAVHCHFDDNEMPKMIRLHFVKDEVMSI
ncbi:MAG: 2-oxoisovalerate dehydrogenase [Firmicutes bacterium]|nr:2-oxoisovalerate dehydrogenase [Bacillota bacterium]